MWCATLEKRKGSRAMAATKKSSSDTKSSGKKYGAKSHEKVHKALHEEKQGSLKSGSGKKVTSRKQAIAIGLSEARKEGDKVPKRKS